MVYEWYPALPDRSKAFVIGQAQEDDRNLPSWVLLFVEGPKSRPNRITPIRKFDRIEDALASLAQLRSGMPLAEVIAFRHGPLPLTCPAEPITRPPDALKRSAARGAALRAIKALEPQVIRS